MLQEIEDEVTSATNCLDRLSESVQTGSTDTTLLATLTETIQRLIARVPELKAPLPAELVMRMQSLITRFDEITQRGEGWMTQTSEELELASRRTRARQAYSRSISYS